MTTLPQCTVPLFDSPAEALGWAYVIERSTLGHHNLFRHLASRMPGEIAFASSFLKSYFGAVGEMWKNFLHALDMIDEAPGETMVIEFAKSAFSAHRHRRRRRRARRLVAAVLAGRPERPHRKCATRATPRREARLPRPTAFSGGSDPASFGSAR